MYISVDPKSSTPLYVQIKDQMRLAVATGVLRPGDQLPTVRDLGIHLRVNPNTVARVYRELQAEGLLASRQGSGTFVAEQAVRVGQGEGRRLVLERLAEATTMGRNLGLSQSDIAELLEQVLQRPAPETPDTEVTSDE
jgi:GntR family transcriptional regulator